jgi:hypothetical protein
MLLLNYTVMRDTIGHLLDDIPTEATLFFLPMVQQKRAEFKKVSIDLTSNFLKRLRIGS